ncbi:hypothetical protein [Glycomyces tarimensis]
MSRTIVTGEDVELAVHLTAQTLGEAPAEAWDRQAGPMECSCWDAIDHLNNGMFSYALRLAPPTPRVPGGVPLLWERPGVDGPLLPITGDRSKGPATQLELLVAMGGLVSGMARGRTPDVRAWHIWGVADPEGFAAMGVAETILHAFDLAEGLGLEWHPPADLCARTLARLFPDAPTDTEPWPTLLWAAGRGDLPGHEPVGPDWQWHSAPLSEGRP